MTDVPLREYIEALFAEHQRAHEVQHAAAEDARKEAQADIARRLEGLNELRANVVEDRAQFLRLDVYDEKHQNLVSAVAKHESQLVRLEDAAQRAEQADVKAERNRKWLVGLTVTVLLAVAAIVVNLVINLAQLSH